MKLKITYVRTCMTRPSRSSSIIIITNSTTFFLFADFFCFAREFRSISMNQTESVGVLLSKLRECSVQIFVEFCFLLLYRTTLQNNQFTMSRSTFKHLDERCMLLHLNVQMFTFVYTIQVNGMWQIWNRFHCFSKCREKYRL